jgi:lysophospholipase L1-like esterase
VRSRGANLVLLLLSLGGTLLCLEAATRWIPAKPPPVFFASRFNGTEPMNSQGFRDFEYPEEKGEKVFRILAVGDSFTFGVGVNFDDSYPKKLERLLNYHGREGEAVYQVLNLGHPRLSTPEEVQGLKRRLAQYRPDLVVLGYCLNDAEDWSDPEGVQRLRRQHLLEGYKPPAAGVAGFLHDHSALYRLVAGRMGNSLSFARQKDYYRALYREDARGWRRTREALSDLGRISAESRIPVVVMLFPLFSFGLSEQGYPFAEIHRRIAAAAAEADLSFLDLFHAYRNLNPLRLEAVPYQDPHPSAIGHAVAAERLLKFLLTNDLLPEDRDLKHLSPHAPPTPFR